MYRLLRVRFRSRDTHKEEVISNEFKESNSSYAGSCYRTQSGCMRKQFIGNINRGVQRGSGYRSSFE